MSRGDLADGLAPDPPSLSRLLKRLAAASDLPHLLDILVAQAPRLIPGITSVEIVSGEQRSLGAAPGVVFHLDRDADRNTRGVAAHGDTKSMELDSVVCLLSRIVAMRSRADVVEHAQLLEAEIDSSNALLSAREAEIVEPLREGLTASAAAERLQISRRTVERHIYHIYRKLGVSCRRELLSRLGQPGAPPPSNLPFERRS